MKGDIKSRQVGVNFLHNHAGKENILRAQGKLTDGHVIVDQRDWEEVIAFFKKKPHLIVELGESNV
jgi:hypothetical protein